MKILKKTLFYFVFSAILFLFMFPFILVLMSSFKSNIDIINAPLALPKEFDFTNYINAFVGMNYFRSISNSLYITITSIVFTLVTSSMAAHLFVRKRWAINKFIFFAMVASMIIPFQTIMIPLIKTFGTLGLMNNRNTLLFYYAAANTPLAVFMYHGFIKGIPFELEEAAQIDGCTPFGVFFKVVLPLLKPISLTLFILNALWVWNDFLFPYIVLKGKDNATLPLSTFRFVESYFTDYSLTTSGMILTILPIIIVYLFMQKHIVEGVVQGAIK